MEREKTKRRGGLQKVQDAEMPPPQRMEGAFQSWTPSGLALGSSSPGLSFPTACPPPMLHGSALTNPPGVPALSLLTGSFSHCPHTGRVAWFKFQPSCYIYAELSRTSSSGLSWPALSPLSTHNSGHVILPETPWRAFVSHSWPLAEPPRSIRYICNLDPFGCLFIPCPGPRILCLSQALLVVTLLASAIISASTV